MERENMSKKRRNLISALEAATRGFSSVDSLLVSPLFWGKMRHMMSKDPDLIQETQRSILATGHTGTWRGHRLYLDPSVDGLRAKICSKQ